MKFLPGHWLAPAAVVFAAVASGLLSALAYAPVSLGAISFFALVPVTVALYRRAYSPRTYFKAGYLFGVAFFTALLWWIVLLLPAANTTVPWLMTPALILIVAYVSLYPALFFYLLSRLGRGKPFAVVVLGPALWALLEMFRSSGEFGFPWGVAGYALTGNPMMLQGAAYIGVFGMSFVIILVNMLFSYAFIKRSRRARIAFLFVGALAIGLVALHGKMRIDAYSSAPKGETVRVAVVQPNVDLYLKWKPEFSDSTFRLIERLARHSASLGAQLIVFPETSAPVYIHHDKARRGQLARLARELDASIFIGFLDGRRDGPDGELNIYNSSGVFNPEGGLFQYDKRHLLPFGEAIPFAWKFRVLKRVRYGQANFHPGPSVRPLPSSGGRLGPLICFESIFSDLSRDFVNRGADMLLNITNDGWFGDTPGPYQHKDMSIYRAVETGRYVLRSANTGVSVVVDPLGRVRSSLGIHVEGVIIEEIERGGPATRYARWGDMPVLVVLLCFVLVGALWGRRHGG